MNDTPDAAVPRQAHDLTPIVDPTLRHGAGPFRTRLPTYVELLPPCNHACPAGENIQAWLALAQAGDYRQAWETLMRDNPLPAVHGTGLLPPVRNAPAIASELDAAVSIHAVERFLGDMAARGRLERCRSHAATGKRVLVVGAGPSGLSAAYHLARLGHQVEIHEAGPLPGGMMHFGIPAYRLPREDLLKEVARIEAWACASCSTTRSTTCSPRRRPAVSMRCSSRSAPTSASTSTFRRATRSRVLDAVSLLRDVEHRQRAEAGPPRRRLRRRQHGDGCRAHGHAASARKRRSSSTAATARTCRRTPSRPTRRFEEGVKIKWLTSIKELVGPDAHGRADGARRQGPAAADRRIRDARGGRRRAGARPGDRQRLPARACPGIEFKSRARWWSART